MIESLVNCGAMDGFGHPAARMAAAAESAVQTVAGMNNGVIAGQMGLFDAVGGTDELFRIDYPDLPEYPAMQKLAYEKELVGVYLSGHPLDGYRSARGAPASSLRRRWPSACPPANGAKSRPSPSAASSSPDGRKSRRKTKSWPSACWRICRASAS